MKTKQEILDYYLKGNRVFRKVDFDNNESFTSSDFQDAIFENCFFGIDISNSNFKNSKIIDCNLKSTDFTNCNFTNAEINNCLVEAANFYNCDITNLIFEKNTMFGTDVVLNKKTLEIEQIAHPLVCELYQNIPDFEKICDHYDDTLVYCVFGELSTKLYEQILIHNKPNRMINDSFTFFNHLGDKNNKEIDDLLVVGIYEGLYSNKKCNDLARKLLKGKNKELYEYWMINGNIQSDY